MSGRWRQAVVGFLALIALQVTAWAAYRLVDASDREGARIVSEGAALPLRSLSLERPGARFSTETAGQPLVVHFWATWCAPCREELPTFLALGDGSSQGVQLIAASLDENWDVVGHYFDGEPPATVWRLPDPRQLPLEPTLPETWLVRDGQVVARARGAQTWTPRALQVWMDATSESTATQARQR